VTFEYSRPDSVELLKQPDRRLMVKLDEDLEQMLAGQQPHGAFRQGLRFSEPPGQTGRSGSN